MDLLEELLKMLKEEPEKEKISKPETEESRWNPCRETTTPLGQDLLREQTEAQEESQVTRQKDSELHLADSAVLDWEKRKAESEIRSDKATAYRTADESIAAGQTSGVFHVQTEETGEAAETEGNAWKGTDKSAAGLTEEQVLALLDRYLTEEFLATGGDLIGYD